MKAYNSIEVMLLALLSLAAMALSAPAPKNSAATPALPAVDSQALQDAITSPNLVARARDLLDLYETYGDRNPTNATNGTMAYIMDTLAPHSDYYHIDIGPRLEAGYTTGHNMCYQTKSGNQSNVVLLGAHYDAIVRAWRRSATNDSESEDFYEPRPGINDSGSGSMALLETALHLTNYSTDNAVRFCFWTLEEEMRIGTYSYLTNLTASERSKIRLYLNFDQIGSGSDLCVSQSNHTAVPEDPFDGTSPLLTVFMAPGHRQASLFFFKYFWNHGLAAKPLQMEICDEEPFQRYGIPTSGFDDCGMDDGYHTLGDNITNIDPEAWVMNAKALAAAAAHFGTSLDEIPQRIGDGPKPRVYKYRDAERMGEMPNGENPESPFGPGEPYQGDVDDERILYG